MKKLILLFTLLFASLLLLHAQTIEVIGMGVASSDLQTLHFSNPEDIDMVVVEAACILTNKTAEQVRFFEPSGDENYTVNFQLTEENYTPHSNGDYFSFGYFTATFNDVDDKGITLDQITHLGDIRSFVAYVYRQGENPANYHTRINEHAAVFGNGSVDPYIVNIQIPESTQPRNVDITIPFSDLASHTLRWAHVTASAGNIEVESEFQMNTEGEYLRLENIRLPNVPGDVTNVELNIYSPIDSIDNLIGDSFIIGSIIIAVDGEECGECEGQITALDLEYLGNKKNATIKIYKNKIKSKYLIKTFKNVNKGDILSFTGVGKHLKMGPKIRITVNGSKCYTEIHTSCSQDIYAGMVFKNQFLILSGTSFNGGPLCFKPDGNKDDDDDDDDDDDGDDDDNGNNCNKDKSCYLKVTPNPVKNYSCVSFCTVQKGLTTVDLYNSKGFKVKRIYKRNLKKGAPVKLTFNRFRCESGTYYLVVNNGKTKVTKRIKIER